MRLMYHRNLTLNCDAIVGRDAKEAEGVLANALAIIQQATDEDYFNLGLAHSNLGACQFNLEKLAEARTHFEVVGKVNPE